MAGASVKQQLVSFIKVILIIEFVLQVFTFARFTWGAFAQKNAEHDMVRRTWALRDLTFRAVYNEEGSVWEQYYPFVGWRTREMHTPHINVSTDGVRSTVGNPIEGSGLPTIYFFGGSAMWGEGHADSTTIPSLVTEELNRAAPQVTIVNYGEIGYASTQELLRLEELLKSGIRPDHVILYDGCNDFFLSTLDTRQHLTFRDDRMKTMLGNIWSVPDDSETVLTVPNTTVFSVAFWRAVWEQAATYIQIIHYPVMLYTSLTNKPVPLSQPVTMITDPQKDIDNIVTTYLGNVQILDALAQAYHFDYRLVWQPTVYSKDLTPEERNLPDIKPSQYKTLSDIYHTAAVKISESLGDKFVDMSGVFAGVNEPVFTDTCHITVQGNTVVSQHIEEMIHATWGLE